MHRRSWSVATLCACGLCFLAGCAGLQPAEPLAADEQYVCYIGSGLKYRKPRAQTWPDYLIPRPPGGSCMHR